MKSWSRRQISLKMTTIRGWENQLAAMWSLVSSRQAFSTSVRCNPRRKLAILSSHRTIWNCWRTWFAVTTKISTTKRKVNEKSETSRRSSKPRCTTQSTKLADSAREKSSLKGMLSTSTTHQAWLVAHNSLHEAHLYLLRHPNQPFTKRVLSKTASEGQESRTLSTRSEMRTDPMHRQI